MFYDTVLDKLEKLVKLCQETEPDVPSDSHLFSQHLIEAKDMYDDVQEALISQTSDLTRFEMIQVMRNSNRIWRIRNKVKNSNWDTNGYLCLLEDVEDYIATGSKINAIKHYRNVMDRDFNETVRLKQAKDVIDKMAEDMKLRGII
tara:strand:+ start:6740 stop:7177 length:438 start_codon:yes stop_codon:yes gene_type:complete